MIAQEQQLAEVAQIRGEVVKAEWGNQIRNYVFHPYKMVRHIPAQGFKVMTNL